MSKEKKEKPFNLTLQYKALNYVGRYLKSVGWQAYILEFKGVQKQDPKFGSDPKTMKYKFTLLIDFLGKPPIKKKK